MEGPFGQKQVGYPAYEFPRTGFGPFKDFNRATSSFRRQTHGKPLF